MSNVRFVVDVNEGHFPYEATAYGPEPDYARTTVQSRKNPYDAARAALAMAWLKRGQAQRSGDDAPILPAVAEELSKAEAQLNEERPAPMEVPDAVEHAKRDVATITARLSAEGTDRLMLVDGSQYSPSWRVLPGGSTVWETTTDMPAHEHATDLIEAYDETLTRDLDALDLYWDEGCLWVDVDSGPR